MRSDSLRRQCREVVGLLHAEATSWPSVVPRRRRFKGAKAFGLRFERDFALRVKERFPCALHGQWFRFQDANGMGLAQPDVVVVTKKRVLVLEVKLTDTEEARRQLDVLYRPILQHVYKRPVMGVVVVRHLTVASRLERICTTLTEALQRGLKGEVPTLHWLGRGALG